MKLYELIVFQKKSQISPGLSLVAGGIAGGVEAATTVSSSIES